MNRNLSIDQIKTFALLCESPSFVKVAEKLRVSPAVVTRRIVALEKELGTRLFQRTTRKVHPTAEAREWLPQVQSILQQLESIDARFQGESQAPSGLVRVTCPTFLGHARLGKIFSDFIKKHPQIRMDVLLTERMVDLIEESFDLGIRILDNELENTSLIARKLAENEIVVCASPAYLKKYGTPKRPQDLKNHKLLFVDLHEDLEFQKSKIKLKSFESNRPMRCNDGGLLVLAAIEGAGLLVRSKWDAHEALDRGHLIRVDLHDSFPTSSAAYVVYPSSRLLPARTRALVQFLLDQKF